MNCNRILTTEFTKAQKDAALLIELASFLGPDEGGKGCSCPEEGGGRPPKARSAGGGALKERIAEIDRRQEPEQRSRDERTKRDAKPLKG